MVIGVVVQGADLNFCCSQELYGIGVLAVGDMIDQAGDPRIDQGLGAVNTGKMGDITGAATGGNAVQGGLDDGIGLSMNGANAVSLHHQMIDLIAVWLPGGGTIETGGQDTFFEHQHTPHQSPVAGAALGYRIGDLHEVGIPVRSHECLLLWTFTPKYWRFV